MIKYAITSACMNKCEYCIMRNVQRSEERDLAKVQYALTTTRLFDDTIMLTGGEPTISLQFERKAEIAASIFNEVYLTTANWRYVASIQRANKHIDAITYTIHFPEDIYALSNSGLNVGNRPVYAAIVWPQLNEIVERAGELAVLGFSGLTINEDQRGTAAFDEDDLPDVSDFSYKVNRRGHCLSDTTIIFPDLEVETHFQKWV